MIQLINSGVYSDEEAHTYTLGDKTLVGITGMIQRQLFPDKYKDIPQFILNRAAAKGSRIHSECQFADETGLPPESIEAMNYIAIRTNGGFEPVANEYTVTDREFYASNIDCVWNKDGNIVLADIKTTSHLDEEYLSWQLSIYAYLFEMQNPELKVSELYGVWLRGEVSELVEIKRIDVETIKELLQCEREGRKFRGVPAEVEDRQLIIAQNAIDMLVEAKAMTAYYKKEEEKVTSALMEAMKANNIKSWDAGVFKASYTPPTKSSTFDGKKFKDDHPEMYAQYMKETEKKESIRITIREDKQ